MHHLRLGDFIAVLLAHCHEHDAPVLCAHELMPPDSYSARMQTVVPARASTVASISGQQGQSGGNTCRKRKEPRLLRCTTPSRRLHPMGNQPVEGQLNMILPAVHAIFEPRGRAVTNSLCQGARLTHFKHVDARSINAPKPNGRGSRAVVMPCPLKKTVQWWVEKMTLHRGGD